MKHLIMLFPADPSLKYNDLKCEIQCFSRFMSLGPFCWVVLTTLDSEEIYKRLKPCIDDEDRLFVCAFEYWCGNTGNSELCQWPSDQISNTPTAHRFFLPSSVVAATGEDFLHARYVRFYGLYLSQTRSLCAAVVAVMPPCIQDSTAAGTSIVGFSQHNTAFWAEVRALNDRVFAPGALNEAVQFIKGNLFSHPFPLRSMSGALNYAKSMGLTRRNAQIARNSSALSSRVGALPFRLLYKDWYGIPDCLDSSERLIPRLVIYSAIFLVTFIFRPPFLEARKL